MSLGAMGNNSLPSVPRLATVTAIVIPVTHTGTWTGRCVKKILYVAFALIDPQCDCPANYYCRPFLGRPDNTYADGYCYPFEESTRACVTPADCDVYQAGFETLTTIRFWRFSCVDGYCRPCNAVRTLSISARSDLQPESLSPQTHWGNTTKTCTAWDHVTQTGSSRPGETRSCNAQGYLIGAGVLATTQPPPTTTPPPATTTVTTVGTTTSKPPTTTGGGATSSPTSTSSGAFSVSPAALILFGALLVVYVGTVVERS